MRHLSRSHFCSNYMQLRPDHDGHYCISDCADCPAYDHDEVDCQFVMYGVTTNKGLLTELDNHLKDDSTILKEMEEAEYED